MSKVRKKSSFILFCLFILLSICSCQSDFEIDNNVLKKYNGHNENVEVSDLCTSIKYEAFKNNTHIKYVLLPNTVKEIGSFAFQFCENLKSINLENVEVIDSFAFSDCKSLSDITLSSKLTKINSYVFQNCSSLSSINIPDNITIIDSGAFENCSHISEVSLSEGVETIDEFAFYKCTNLESLNIPCSIKQINDFAFSESDKLTDVMYNGTKEQWEKIETGMRIFLNDVTIHCNDGSSFVYKSKPSPDEEGFVPSVTTSSTPKPVETTKTSHPKYILNPDTKKIHYYDCYTIKNPENYIGTDDYDGARKQGYTPCQKCM